MLHLRSVVYEPLTPGGLSVNFKTIAIAAGAALAISTAAAAPTQAAVTFDARGSFNGSNGNNGFSYGYTDNAAFTAFDVSSTGSDCALPGGTCLYGSAPGAIPQASLGGSYGTVDVTTDALILHPGNSADRSVYSEFAAATPGAFNYKIDLKSIGTDTTNGIGYTTFTRLGSIVTLGTRTLLGGYHSTASLTGPVSLAAGESFGVIVDYNGNHGGDSTSLNFSLTAVPEPATWGLMIMGFAGMGSALRSNRRRMLAA